MQKFSYLNSINAGYVDLMFSQYQNDPDSVDSTWKYFFDGLGLGEAIGQSAATDHADSTLDLSSEVRVADLIRAYREQGRAIADLNPLVPPPTTHPDLELTRFGLSDADLETAFHSAQLIGFEGPTPLREIVARLKSAYCGTIAAELVHVPDRAEREWLQERFESRAGANLDRETRIHILKRLTATETFERFLHTRYVAQKRFSVEGGDAVIPCLDAIVETGASLGAQEFVIGMAHRGRLNVLTQVMGKKPEYIFTEFEGNYHVDPERFDGDVKYHIGYSHDVQTRQGKSAHLSLAFNPSHLEFVNPVIEGMARAKQDQRGDKQRSTVIPIAIHGDAALAGQGVCYETLNLSQLDGYATGGTLHIVINNQVGFTTSPIDARSTQYCTDLAKTIDAPIFHVNGDDPEALWWISRLCTEYRQKFRKDVFIDLVCYRKHGHNEGDEPAFTQPLLYKNIKNHHSPREVYAAKLTAQGIVTTEQAQQWIDEVTATYSEAQKIAKAEGPHPDPSAFEGRWKGLRRAGPQDWVTPATTRVKAEKLRDLARQLNSMPAGFHLHPKLGRFFEGRLKAVEEGRGIDWGCAEALAYASLLDEGTPVRLSGQDVGRGTFTHRHAVLQDAETGERYIPHAHLKPGQAPIHVHNSHLSETGVMGFEYGYALSEPQSLVIWEAQFGDFANGAQVIIDQYLAASESKWLRMNGLVLLLPHGYEGQGPEHSSARLERFLQLSGKLNWAVCNFSTPANFFHALRRQVKREFRKPLIVMSPKSMLRHPMAVSALEELTSVDFQEVLDDPTFAGQANTAKELLLCSGKVYWDLVAERQAQGRKDVAILRLEQLYPWPARTLGQLLQNSYRSATKITWVQEEPRNMGAWTHVFGNWSGGLNEFGDNFGASAAGGRTLQYCGRTTAASPAVGSAKAHEQEQRRLLEAAFGRKAT